MTAANTALEGWLRRLESYSPHDIELGLERVQDVLQRLPLTLPDNILIVGGTNGKGSTVAFTHALLRARGLNVGAYTSPHLHRYNERVRLNDRFVSDAELIRSFETVDTHRGDTPLTYFEFGTLAALVAFDQAQLDHLVLEVGLGGRLDAVNVVEPIASIITNVALDHCDWLGDTIDKIAAEKAGILRPGKPLIFAAGEPPEPIVSACRDAAANLVVAEQDYRFSTEGRELWNYAGVGQEFHGLEFPALLGNYQLRNAAGAIALLEAADLLGDLQSADISHAFTSLELPGRMHRVDKDCEWLFDVAHNPAAAAALRESLPPVRGKTVAIIGILKDKDVDGVLLELAQVVDVWITITPDTKRAIDSATLAQKIAAVSSGHVQHAESASSALIHATRIAGPDDRVLVTGSFHTVGPILHELSAQAALTKDR